jgi:hypothetical protein
MEKGPALDIIVSPIEFSPLSEEFKEMARSNGFETFDDFRDAGLSLVPVLPGSGYRLYSELLSYLQDNGLLDMFDRNDWIKRQ